MSQLMSIFCLVAIASSAPAFAIGSPSTTTGDAVYFEETFFPVYVSKNDAQSPAGGGDGKSVPTERGFGYDARTTLGYIYSGVLLGLTYNSFNETTNRNTTPDYEGKHFHDSKIMWGVTVGYFLGNVRLTYTHFLSAKRNVSQKYTSNTNGAISTSEVWENSAGNGYQVGLGYDFQLGAGLSISPTLIYQSVHYAKQMYRSDAGVAGTTHDTRRLNTYAVDDELKPMITLTARF
jgi:hypothetical protein